MRTVYKSQIRQNDTIEVGPGNLKLLYSGKRAKLTQYINSKTLVCICLEIDSPFQIVYLHISLIFICNLNHFTIEG